jgi:hypothetical protein
LSFVVDHDVRHGISEDVVVRRRPECMDVFWGMQDSK